MRKDSDKDIKLIKDTQGGQALVDFLTRTCLKRSSLGKTDSETNYNLGKLELALEIIKNINGE